MPLDGHDLPRAQVSPAPFAVAAILAWVTVAVVSSAIRWPAYAGSVAALGVTAALLALSHRSRQGERRWALPIGNVPAAVALLLAVALLRYSTGGIGSGAGLLAMISVFYVALAGESRRELYAVVAALFCFYLLPILLIGPPEYPTSQYGAALLSLMVSTTIGIGTQELVTRVRENGEESRRRERMLEQVSTAVRTLFDSTHARRDVCEAVRSVSDASLAILFELDQAGGFVSTAMAGLDVAPIQFPAGEQHPVHRALVDAESTLVTGDADAHRHAEGLWQACGRPTTVLYQPLLRGVDVVGVLVVAWPEQLTLAGSHATIVALLAHEAALAITRADQIRHLAEMAETDPLTELPNRRAWDARLAQASTDGQGFTIAMLDLDNFKLFNDTYGHPAGDRLLVETAAAWRDQVRTGDLLARLGGEEFGVLLFDCGIDAARDVIERLRSMVADDQTCSVGLAQRRPSEPVDATLARADRALYDAKEAGRDRAFAAA